MNTKQLITGGPLFDGIALYEKGSVLIENGIVNEIFHDFVKIEGVPCIDTCGDLIMPGIVDLHSDSLERNIEKRKGVFFDLEFAILNLDRQLASCGITSFCHAISFADNELGLRAPEEAKKCIKAIKKFAESEQALVKHNLHIRYEVGSQRSFQVVMDLIAKGLADMISIMDHTPGQGQFRSMESYIKFHSEEYDIPHKDILEKANTKQQQNGSAWEKASDLVKTAKSAGIPILSHDDDTGEKIEFLKKMGVEASEFPVTIEAAEKAYKSGMKVYMGAPNLIRDLSTNGNLRTSEALKKGICTGFVSDYYPESLFQAAFIATKHISDPALALSKVTSGPGSFLSSDSKPGFLESGADADIIFVNREYSWAHVSRAFVKGKSVFQS